MICSNIALSDTNQVVTISCDTSNEEQLKDYESVKTSKDFELYNAKYKKEVEHFGHIMQGRSLK